MHTKPAVEATNKIKVTLNNRDRELFRPFKERLTRFLSNRLQNTNITLELIAEKQLNQQTKSIPTSNTEKFVFLTQKYPILKTLKERFDLEVER